MADPILLWNEAALEANRVSHTNGKGEQTGPTLSSRALAIVHLAMYDAYAGIADHKDYPRYLETGPPSPGIKNPSDEVFAAAIAAAARRTLSLLYPSQAEFFDSVFEGSGAGPHSSKDAIAANVFGEKVGQAIWDDRAKDPGADGVHKPSAGRGRHRPDPDNAAQGFHAPHYGDSIRGFGIEKRHQIAPPPFKDGDDPEYLDALKEVRGLGIAPELTGTLPKGFRIRTPDESIVGTYWAYDGAAELGTPPRLYNQIIRQVAKKEKNTVGANARLFAFVNVAMADAGILAWEQKYRHDFWRPVVGIREHDKSQGPAGLPGGANPISDEGDPAWLPLGAPNSNRPGMKNFTPPFPAYPSGHATFAAAAFHITRLFYKQGGRFGKKLADDKLFDGLAFVSEELNGITVDNRGTVRPKHRRKFPRGLLGMILENGFSRVLLGVHWVFDAFAVKRASNGTVTPDLTRTEKKLFIGGVPLGLLIAEDVFDFGGGKAPKYSISKPLPRSEEEDGEETFASSFRPAAQSR